MTREFILILALIAGPAFAEKPSSDLTNVRGFNYTTSLDTSIGPRGHSGLWLKYDANQVERDLTNAQRLNLNQVRVFVAGCNRSRHPLHFNAATECKVMQPPGTTVCRH